MMYRIAQFWYWITCPVVKLYDRISGPINAWFEWEDAKYWAADHRPGWVQMATKCRNKETKQYYRDKILEAYREAEA